MLRNTLLKTISPGSTSQSRAFTQITATFPEVIGRQFKEDLEQYAEKAGEASSNASFNIYAVDKRLRSAGRWLERKLPEYKNDPQVADFIHAIEEFNSRDGKAKALVIESLPRSDSNPALMKQLSVFATAHLLGARECWKMPKDSVSARVGLYAASIFNVKAEHDGIQDAAQVPHVDQYIALDKAPPLAVLYCETNEQRTPTYFISAKAIWDKLDDEERKVLTGDNFMITQQGFQSQPFPIFKIEGEHCAPQSIEICFDLDSTDFSFKKEAEASFYKLHQIVYDLSKPYHEQKNVPANNDDTSQYIGKPRDVVFWNNKLGMHGRPPVEKKVGAPLRDLTRFYFS